MLERAELHMTAISQLSAQLTPDNHAAVLEEAKHKTKNEIAELIARISPRPDVPSSVRKLPRRKKQTVGADGAAGSRNATASSSAPISEPAVPGPERAPASPTAERSSPADAEPARQQSASSLALVPPPAPRSPDPEPLAEARYRLQVTLGQKGRDNLQALADLLAHQIPNGDPAAIVELALETLLEKVTKQRTAATDSPRTPRSTETNGDRRSRHVPAHIRRAVWERDGSRCSFVGDDGRRCNETRALEIGHLSPWGMGGEHSVDNCALRCPGHNRYEAIRDYGAELIASKVQRDDDLVREVSAQYRRLAPWARSPNGDSRRHYPANAQPSYACSKSRPNPHATPGTLPGTRRAEGAAKKTTPTRCAGRSRGPRRPRRGAR
jgi:5-methylcytosine-specific restriction endonuclease McrA